MEKKIDARVIRSKRMMSDALARLLEKKNYGSITIKDIMDEACLSKNTFYNNFKTKDDVFRCLFSHYADVINEEISAAQERTATDNVLLFFGAVSHLLFENKTHIGGIFVHDTNHEFYWMCLKLVRELLRDDLISFVKRQSTPQQNELLCDLFVGAFVQAVKSVAEGHFTGSEQDWYSIIVTIWKKVI